MDSSLLRLVCICSILVSFVACQEEDHSHHRPYRPDINPDMELMPMTRFRPDTTARTITQAIREPISLPDLPHGTDESSYEYFNYDYYDNGADMSSSGYIHHHALHTTTQSSDVETTTTSQTDAEEYDYDDEHDSNALNQHMAASAPGRHSCYWATLMITLLWLMPL